MASGPIVAGAPIEELMAMTVPELISWLTKNNVTLPSSKQTKQYYRNLAFQTPDLIMGGTLLGESQLTVELKVRRPRRKKDFKDITPQATHSVDSPSMITTRSKQAAALRAQQEVQQGENRPLFENLSIEDIPIEDKEIEMDFPTEAGEVVAAPESPTMSEKTSNTSDVGRNELQKIVESTAFTRTIKKSPKLYYMLPILIMVIAMIIGVLTQFYAFHVVIDPASSKYQLSITSRSRQP